MAPRTARIWNTGKYVAADNRCKKQWLLLTYSVASESSPGVVYRSVAPGAHFRHDGWDLANPDEGDFTWHLVSGPVCGGDVYRPHPTGRPEYLPCRR